MELGRRKQDLVVVTDSNLPYEFESKFFDLGEINGQSWSQLTLVPGSWGFKPKIVWSLNPTRTCRKQDT